ncbi:MAG: hypothetical protein NT007_17355 [Candidatus Kapabacteria bacterium]|nr:hypothetical protein [Candidatus Kapabacteria bacterium]
MQFIYKIFNIFILITVFVLIHCACGNSTAINTPIVFPDSNVSWTYHVQPFIKMTCATVGCHSTQSQAAGIVLDDYMMLFSGSALGMVVPNDPEASRLVQYLEFKVVHNGSIYWKFDSQQLNGVKKWISEGAKMN